MKQRFSKRTRLVSALLTLAMVFTFLPFSAFAATFESIDKIAFATNGCEALQIKEGAEVYDWLESFKERMSKTDESLHPLVEVKGLGFSIGAVTTFSVCTRDGSTTQNFTKDKTYFLELCIYPNTGRIFETGKEFDSVQVDGVEMTDQMCRKPLPGSNSNVAIIRLPLSFRGTHKTTYHPKKPATCTATGTKTYFECEKCGKLFKNVEETEEYANREELIIPKLGHVADTDWSWDSTTHYYKCEKCGIPMPDKDPVPHLYGSDGHTCIVCNYTWQAIEKVKVWVTEPAAGQQATSTVSVGSTANYYATCKWFHGKQEFTGTFEEGETYTLQVTVKTGCDSKYKFVNGTTEYEVNGDLVSRMPMSGESYTGPWESATLSGIKYVAKSAEEGSVITNIQMTIPAPVAGNSPSSCKAQKSDPRYTISYRWAEVDAAGKTISHDVTTFEEGKHYRVTIVPKPNTGYEFEDGEQDAIINGKAYSSFTSPGMNPKRFKEYYVTFTAVAGGGSTGGGSTGGGGTVTPPEPPVTPPEPPVTPPSGGGDGGGAVVIVAAAGAVAAGVVGYGVYNYVSGRKLQALLPEGVAAPENRAQTALLLWNTAGRPEPADAPAFADVADPDTAKAAQWCVEQGLMKRRLNGKFAPGSSIPAYQVLNAYRKLAGG